MDDLAASPRVLFALGSVAHAFECCTFGLKAGFEKMLPFQPGNDGMLDHDSSFITFVTALLFREIHLLRVHGAGIENHDLFARLLKAAAQSNGY